MKVLIDNRHPSVAIPEETIGLWVEHILEALGLSEAEVSIVLMDDDQIADLNLRYLSRKGPTNVIAFPMGEGDGVHLWPQLLGDVVISLDAARKESEDAGIPYSGRILALLVHGILHLIGYDHVGDEDRQRQMEAEEGRILEIVRVAVRDLC